MLQWVDTAIAFSVVMLMLSLLITSAVQVISALLDLRGRNLASHVELLLEQIHPYFRDTITQYKGKVSSALEATAKNAQEKISHLIAQAVVTHPAVTHGIAETKSWFNLTRQTRAKAISGDELKDVLRDLISPDSAKQLEPLAKEALQAAMAVPDPTRLANDVVDRITEAMKAGGPHLSSRIDEAMRGVVTRASQVEKGIARWFDTVMRRSSDVYQRYTRAITVSCALLLAFLLHVDSGQIVRQLASSPEVRAKVLALQDSTLAQADRVSDNNFRATQALDSVQQQEKSAAASDAAQVAKLFAGEHSKLIRCIDGTAWLDTEGAKANVPQDSIQRIQTEFKAECQKQTEIALGAAGEQMRTLRSQLGDSGITLISTSRTYKDYLKDGHHLAGVIATVVLLSFGAPFWFNTLRQLVNLKPAISNKVDNEEEPKAAAAAQTQAAGRHGAGMHATADR